MPTYDIPHVHIVVSDRRRTSPVKFSPEYEVPILKHIFPQLAETREPGNGILVRKLPKPKRGFRDPFAGLRFRSVQALSVEHLMRLEKGRLRRVYNANEAGKKPPFDEVYPGDTFEIKFRQLYPSLFTAEEEARAQSAPENEVDDIWQGEVDDSPAQVRPDAPTDPEYDTPEDPWAAEEDDAEAIDREAAVAELCELVDVEARLANKLIDAGFTSIAEVAAAAPEDLRRVHGIGRATARSIVDHANELIGA